MWPLYLTAFTTFSDYPTAGLELQMLRWPRVFMVFVLFAVAASLLTRYLRRIWLAGEPGDFRFSAGDPDAMFQGFHLSEGLAAAPEERADAADQRLSAL